MTERLNGRVDANEIRRLVNMRGIQELQLPSFSACSLSEEAIEACRENQGRLRVREITIYHGYEGSILPLLDLADKDLLHQLNIHGRLVDETNCQQIAQIVNQCPNLTRLNISGPTVCSVVAALTNLPASISLAMPVFTNEDFDRIVPKFNQSRETECRLIADDWEASIEPLHRFLRKVQFSRIHFRAIEPSAICWDGEYWAQACTRQVRQRMLANQRFLNSLKTARMQQLPPEVRREVYLREVGPWSIDFSDYVSHSKNVVSSDDDDN
jgi:hypothetical protein